jgi:putative phage-type endonuclease
MSLTKEELKMIGGSDAAAIAGAHPYKRPIDVWRRIVEGHETEQTAPMRRGILLEPVIRQMFQEETGLQLLGPRSLRSPKHAWLRASLDDVAIMADGEEHVVEFKSVNARQAHRYGDGSDDLPEEHICQTQFYLGVTGWHLAHLAALIGGDELRHYRLIADHDLQRVLFEACERFWVDNIKTGKPPPVDGSESYSEWIDQHFSNRRPDFVAADLEAESLAAAYRHQCEALETTKGKVQSIRQKLEMKIGDASGVEGSFGRISFKRNKDVSRVDWQGVAANLNPPPELVQKFTVVKPGPRVFRPSWKKAENE